MIQVTPRPAHQSVCWWCCQATAEGRHTLGHVFQVRRGAPRVWLD